MTDTRWTAASEAARKAGHHWPADCLAEAALILPDLLDRLKAAEEELAEQRERAEWAIEKGIAWREKAEAAEAKVARIEALADEWETAHGNPPVDPSHISVRHAKTLRAALRGSEDGRSTDSRVEGDPTVRGDA